MDKLSQRKIVLVTRKTRLDDLVMRYNTIDQARFYIEHMGNDFSDYIREDTVYKRVVTSITEMLSMFGLLQVLDRIYVPTYIFGKNDIVVVVGQDGLVANTLKYLDEQMVIGVNPDPDRWDGVLLHFSEVDIPAIMKDVLGNRRSYHGITMAKAELNDGQVLYGVNDLFIGQKTHVSSRYELSYHEKIEFQSSSGIIVSTGLGATGWFKSIIKGAGNIAAQINGEDLKHVEFNVNSDFLYFSVREPFPSKHSQAGITFGKITKGDTMALTSYMPENGVIFSDGVESDFLQFNSGISAKISVAEKVGRLVI